VPPDEVSSCQESEICMIDRVMRNRPRDHQLLCLCGRAAPPTRSPAYPRG
jgi:hypothetical protein